MNATTIESNPFVLDYSRDDELLRVCLSVGLEDMTPEEAVERWFRHDILKASRFQDTTRHFSLEQRDAYVDAAVEALPQPSPFSVMVDDITEGHPELVTQKFQECLERYSQTFTFEIPTEIIQDVRAGILASEKWKNLKFAKSVKLRVGTSPERPFFEMQWEFDTKSPAHSTFVFFLNIEPSPSGEGSLTISLKGEETNRVDDHGFDSVCEILTYAPPKDGKPLEKIYFDDWNFYDPYIHGLIEYPKDSFVTVLEDSVMKAKSVDQSNLARIFF
jgi:hypothetical protein